MRLISDMLGLIDLSCPLLNLATASLVKAHLSCALEVRRIRCANDKSDVGRSSGSAVDCNVRDGPASALMERVESEGIGGSANARPVSLVLSGMLHTFADTSHLDHFPFPTF